MERCAVLEVRPNGVDEEPALASLEFKLPRIHSRCKPFIREKPSGHGQEGSMDCEPRNKIAGPRHPGAGASGAHARRRCCWRWGAGFVESQPLFQKVWYGRPAVSEPLTEVPRH